MPHDASPCLERPIALLALPNTGTDWLAELWLRQNDRLRYCREFFNPICNPRYEDVLGWAFGCEMVDNYKMIARPYCPCDEVYEQTWAREDHNFTKENYCAFKVDWLVTRFRCFVLYRRAELSLPGGRLPVKAWYCALYGSLLRNRAALPRDVRWLVDFARAEADTVNKRQVAAFAIYYYQLLKSANQHGLHVLDYDDLMRCSAEELVPLLSGLPGVIDAPRLARDIILTRRPSRKDFSSLQADTFYARLLERTQWCHGEVAALAHPSINGEWGMGNGEWEEGRRAMADRPGGRRPRRRASAIPHSPFLTD
jgi:hypothetical protein